MSEASLQARLRRLRRPPPVAAGPLETLEETMLGESGAGLTLKARLERLVAVAARAAAAREPQRPQARPLEELIAGRRGENERGEYFLIDTDRALDALHGDVPLGRCRALPAGVVGVLTGEARLAGFDLGRAAFLDTETTGLAGGTGTAAFLVGVGSFEADRFQVRQYFMRDYHEEAALLRGLAADLARFDQVVTFNGRIFDLPLLESRYRMNREPYPLAGVQHLDLLPPARRLWKTRLVSCRLQALEEELLRLRRRGDVRGEEIPRIYFDYVRRRDGRALMRVLEHNRLDVVSLAALAVLACQWVDEDWAEDPRDVYCLARVLERARLFERCERHYRRVAEAGEGPLRVAALLRLGARAKREGDHLRAAELWRKAAEAGDWRALRELAVYHEHRSRDLAAALGVVERALRRPSPAGSGTTWRGAAEFHRRRERLLAKLDRAALARPEADGRR